MIILWIVLSKFFHVSGGWLHGQGWAEPGNPEEDQEHQHQLHTEAEGGGTYVTTGRTSLPQTHCTISFVRHVNEGKGRFHIWYGSRIHRTSQCKQLHPSNLTTPSSRKSALLPGPSRTLMPVQSRKLGHWKNVRLQAFNLPPSLPGMSELTL